MLFDVKPRKTKPNQKKQWKKEIKDWDKFRLIKAQNEPTTIDDLDKLVEQLGKDVKTATKPIPFTAETHAVDYYACGRHTKAPKIDSSDKNTTED